MGCHEIKVYSIIRHSYPLASKHFENFCFRYLDDCQIFLKVNLIKAEHLLLILYQVTNNIQFTLEKSQTRLTLDIMLNKSGTKSWMDIFNKPTDSKQYISFMSNHPCHCLTNIPFLLQEEYVPLLKMRM